jgi:hypothetical protein
MYQDELADIEQHHIACRCGRCHTSRTASGLASKVSEAMLAVYKQDPSDPRVDRLCDSLELLNHVARTGVYPAAS